MPSNTSSSSAESPGGQRAVFIIGAGRSGTSAIARGVQALGVDLGNDFKHATRKNPTGFFEDAALLALSKRVRRCLGLRADSVHLLPADAWDDPRVAGLRREAIDIVRTRFGDAPVWGFKYGRTLRIWPFWEPVLAELGARPAFVLALRNPISVARSRARLDARRGTQEKSDLEWIVSVVPYLSRLCGHPIAVVDYDRLMGDPAAQLRRVAAILDLPVDAAVESAMDAYGREFLRPEMRHSRLDPDGLNDDPRLNPLCRRAYQLLHELAGHRADPPDETFWNAWAEVERECLALGPVLEHVDRVEAEYRRARWNPLSPVAALARFVRDGFR